MTHDSHWANPPPPPPPYFLSGPLYSSFKTEVKYKKIHNISNQIREITWLYVDVVQAYKDLQKEKSALEKSLRVLGTSGKVDSPEKDGDLEEGVKEESENTFKEITSDSTKPLKPEQTEVR